MGFAESLGWAQYLSIGDVVETMAWYRQRLLSTSYLIVRVAQLHGVFFQKQNHGIEETQVGVKECMPTRQSVVATSFIH